MHEATHLPKTYIWKANSVCFFFETHKVSNEIICLEVFLINIPLNLCSARELRPPWFFRPASQHKLKWPNRPSGSTNRPEPWKEYLWLENLGPHWLWNKYRNMEYRKKYINAFHKMKLYQLPKAFDQLSLGFCLSRNCGCEGAELVCSLGFPIVIGSWAFLLTWVLLVSVWHFCSSSFGLATPGNLFNQNITFYQLWPTAEGERKNLQCKVVGWRVRGPVTSLRWQGQIWVEAC